MKSLAKERRSYTHKKKKKNDDAVRLCCVEYVGCERMCTNNRYLPTYYLPQLPPPLKSVVLAPPHTRTPIGPTDRGG